jgi:membrane protease YdiL (CAAX protease family)
MNTLIARLNAVASTPPPWSLAAALVAVAAAFAFIIVGTLVGGAWFGDPANPLPPFAQLVGWLIAAVLAALYVLQTRRAAADREALRLAPGGTPLALVLFVAFGLAIAIDLVALILTSGTFVSTPALLPLAPFGNGAGLREWAVAVVLLVIAQPVSEGLVFRGVLLPSLRSALSGLPGIVAQGVVCGVFHFLAYTPAYPEGGIVVWVYGLVVPLLAGVIFGGVRVLTGSTRAAMFAQAAFGLFALAKHIIIIT